MPEVRHCFYPPSPPVAVLDITEDPEGRVPSGKNIPLLMHVRQLFQNLVCKVPVSDLVILAGGADSPGCDNGEHPLQPDPLVVRSAGLVQRTSPAVLPQAAGVSPTPALPESMV